MPDIWGELKKYLADAAPGGSLNPEVTRQGVLDAAALATTPVPVVGDVVGLGSDVYRMMKNPKERTPLNYGLAALGAVPFVPSGMTRIAKLEGGLRSLRRSAPQDEALETARRNAVRMLGLPENNTALDRARAMGYVEPAYHGSPNPNIRALDLSRGGENTGNTFGVDASWATSNPKSASGYAVQRQLRSLLNEYGLLPEGMVSEGATVYPLLIRAVDYTPRDAKGGGWMMNNRQALEAAEDAGAPGAVIRNLKDNPTKSVKSEIADVYGIMDPSTVRSRFAVFDPARVRESGLGYAEGGPVETDTSGQGFASGGLVTYNPAEVDDLTNQLRAELGLQ